MGERGRAWDLNIPGKVLTLSKLTFSHKAHLLNVLPPHNSVRLVTKHLPPEPLRDHSISKLLCKLSINQGVEELCVT